MSLQYNTEEITKLIPQRPPFLFIDTLVEKGADHIHTQLHLSGEEDFFKGHFPGNPIMPGVLMCEACFQSAAALLSGQAGGDLGVVTKIEQTKFKRMAKPGDILDIKVERLETVANANYMKATIQISGKAIMQTKFTVATVEA